MLYQVLAGHLETFLARRKQVGRNVPRSSSGNFANSSRVASPPMAFFVSGVMRAARQAGSFSCLRHGPDRNGPTGGAPRGDRGKSHRAGGDGIAVKRVSGFSLHANVAVAARDRAWLESLIRYIARRSLASERPQMLRDSRLACECNRPWRDGTSRVICTPMETIEKLDAKVVKAAY